MQYFSIKDIENLTGIKAHTLRIWEKRYNLIISKRKESNHRFFDNEDLKTILRISYLYETEFKISQIAKLSPEAILTYAHIDHSNSKSTEAFILQLINTIIEYDTIEFERVFKSGIKQYGFERAISEIGYGLLRRIGLLWLTDHLIPAQEHFASNLIKKFLINAIEHLPEVKDKSSKEILLFTPIGEFHEIPLLFARWLFKKNNNRVCYLGANMDLEDIAYCTRKRKITHLFCHLITNLTGKSFEAYTLEILKRFPDQKIIISSSQTKNLKIDSPDLTTFKSLEEMIEYINNFKSQELHNSQYLLQ
ncbi:MAG: MerR family transcriptional regulator [Bacteroidetes bacterium]|nr:MerR family transcriptional regulator [Bacteroidota bacterium]